jgi:GT2 family glycosyltransferase
VAHIDVVVVSFNSREHLRDCVEPFAGSDDFAVTVVDNNSSDGTVASISDLPIEIIAQEENQGFAHANNVGIRAGSAPFVLFLNPDARMDPDSVAGLVRVFAEDENVGAVAPHIVNEDGTTDFSLRRFPQTVSTFAQAFFLHRVWPKARWSDEVIRDEAVYGRRASPDWVSGACLVVRRALLEQLGGWDERFFLYCEDKDLCKRIRDLGFSIMYEPRVTALHVGGASAPRPGLLPILAASRIGFAEKHRGRVSVVTERVGLAVASITHMLVGRGGFAARRGHAGALLVALGRRTDPTRASAITQAPSTTPAPARRRSVGR